MDKKKIIIRICFLCVLLFLMVLYFVTRKPIKKIEAVFSEIHGDSNACAFEHSLNTVYFEDHTIDFDTSTSSGEFCGGLALIENKMFITTIDGNNTFKIIESDYYLNDQKIIFDKKYDYRIKALSYGDIIYFGKPGNGNEEITVEGYNLNTKEYLGVLSQSLSMSYYEYISELKESIKCYDILIRSSQIFKVSFVNVTNNQTGETKHVGNEQLLKNPVGKKIIDQKEFFWSNACCINDKIYLICSMWSSEYSVFWHYLYNIVFEYDFETNTLIFKFHFTSYSNEWIYLYFGYE